MKSILTLVGTIFIVFGIIGFSYKYFSYTTNEKIVEIGDVSLSAEKEKRIVITPVVSGSLLAAGVFLVVVGLSRKT